jgi:hypothetical protein
MKNLKLILIGTLLVLSGTAKAQVSVNVNIGSPPQWGPVGYTEVRYYYLPAVQAYYDVDAAMFIYYSRGKWVHRTYLPGRYRNYDLYNGYKVVMTDYRGNTPYTHFHDHKKKYYRGYRDGNQRTIGDRPGNGNSKSRKHNGNNGNRHSKKGKH